MEGLKRIVLYFLVAFMIIGGLILWFNIRADERCRKVYLEGHGVVTADGSCPPQTWNATDQNPNKKR